jgi:hypothetical protein
MADRFSANLPTGLRFEPTPKRVRAETRRRDPGRLPRRPSSYGVLGAFIRSGQAARVYSLD